MAINLSNCIAGDHDVDGGIIILPLLLCCGTASLCCRVVTLLLCALDVTCAPASEIRRGGESAGSGTVSGGEGARGPDPCDDRGRDGDGHGCAQHAEAGAV